VIVSGLALGIDGLAHQAALDAGGLTIAVLPSPLETIVPATHRRLAQTILDQGGALVSEYAAGETPFKQNFIARNRLMAGLGQVLLITEAAEKSGSLHTARFALEQGKTVMAVPGNIGSRGSVGTNHLIKSGATPVTSYIDVLHALGLEPRQATDRAVKGRNAHEQSLLDLLAQGVSDGEELLRRSGLTASAFNQALTMLEISSKVRTLGANHWSTY
ncbi:MAG TPA: DNA-protecting protein DprA, partial [Candidatus Saccharimonadales bacterium]